MPLGAGPAVCIFDRVIGFGRISGFKYETISPISGVNAHGAGPVSGIRDTVIAARK